MYPQSVTKRSLTSLSNCCLSLLTCINFLYTTISLTFVSHLIVLLCTFRSRQLAHGSIMPRRSLFNIFILICQTLVSASTVAVYATSPTATQEDSSIRWTINSSKLPSPTRFIVEPLIYMSASHLEPINVVLEIVDKFSTSSLPFLAQPRIIISSPAQPLHKFQLSNHTDARCKHQFQAPFVSSSYVFSRLLLDKQSTTHQTVHYRSSYGEKVFSDNVIDTWHADDPLSNPTTANTTSDACQLFDGRVSNSTPANTYTSATVMVCPNGTLNGIITWFPYGQFIIEPVNKDKCQIERKLTKMKYFKSSFGSKVVQTCQHWVHFISMPPSVPSRPHRFRRSVSLERTIEIMVVTDSTMDQYHGRSLQSYVLALMAMVSHIFEHSSIGNEINIKLVKLTSLVDDKQEAEMFGSAQSTLRRFCQWQYKYNFPSDDHPLHYDTAILLTRRDLCRTIAGKEANKFEDRFKSNVSCDTLGLAHSGQICDRESSCAIVEDNGLSAAFTIAHELGHVLGIPHDDEEKCKKYYNSPEGRLEIRSEDRNKSNVMARMIDYQSHMWSWSPCSKHFITEYLDSGLGDCLLDKNNDTPDSSFALNEDSPTQRRSSHLLNRFGISASSPNNRYLIPGRQYDADKQCQLVFGKEAHICPDMPYCGRLWCSIENEDIGCRTQHMPWADGTLCGHNHWCQQGECVEIDVDVMKPVDGGWSEWSNYSECSLPCGGGVQRSKRECINPRNGGKHCLGPRILYQSCNVKQCDYPIADIRRHQCSQFNGQNFNIVGVSTNVTWVPQYTNIAPSDVCKLYCADSADGEYFLLKPRVIDGTPCSPDTYDICVSGKCLNAGCDHVLGSRMRTDWCGVCGGDNSTCHEISGHFRPSLVDHGYNKVITIPPGATNIEVVKECSLKGAYNWLVMRAENDKYLLNGNFTVNVYKRKWSYGGATVEYSGLLHDCYERINSSRPINQALQIEVLCVGELHIPLISYRYVLSTETTTTKYHWVLDRSWSDCSQVCNGEQHLKRVCVATSKVWHESETKTRQQNVQDEFCSNQHRPASVSRVCNTHCELEWHIIDNEGCTSKCGPGFQYRTVYCSQKSRKHGRKPHFISDAYCKHIGNKPADKVPCNGTECRISYQWKYSEWSSCSIQGTCGEGQQTRQVQCMSLTYLDETQSDSGSILESITNTEDCVKHLSEPSFTTRSCKVDCPNWSASSWGKCSVNCGVGEQTRVVICTHGNQKVNEAYCSSLEMKPPERMTCSMPDCVTPAYPYYSVDQHLNLSSYRRSDLKQPYIDDIISLTNHDDHLKSDQSNDYSIASISNKSFMGIWQTGQWSPCNETYDHLAKIEKRLLEHFYIPDCFNSTEELNIYQSQYILVFKLNETLINRSYTTLSALLNLNEDILKRRRYVACVVPHTQHVLTDSKCDPSIRPSTIEYCPLLSTFTEKFPKFNFRFCEKVTSTTSTTTTTTSAPLIEPNLNENPFDPKNLLTSHSSPSNSISREVIEWRLGTWSRCFCDSEEKMYLMKRLVLCVRMFPIDEKNQNWQHIPDEYCLQNQTPKPDETIPCTQQNDLSANDIHCQSVPEVYQSYDVINQQTDPKQSQHGSSSLLMTTSSTTSTPLMAMTSSLPMTTSSPITKMSIANQTDQVVDDNHKTVHSSLNHDLQYSFNTEPSSIVSTLSSANISPLEPKLSMSNHIFDYWIEWTEWSKCSVQCGNGTQRRDPLCQPGKQCNQLHKPKPEIRSCFRFCDHFQWHPMEWSQCSASCGQGFQTRTIHCYDWTGTKVSDRFCDTDKKPTSRKKCHEKECNAKWSTGPWSECSEQCDLGIQTRQVSCHRINSHGIIDPTPLLHPDLVVRKKRKHATRTNSRRKNVKNRPKAIYRHRHQRHNKRQNYPYRNSKLIWCNEKTKPSDQQPCSMGPCLKPEMTDAFVWRPSHWHSCSSPCGPGHQQRKVYCYSQRHNDRVSQSRCNPTLKPERYRECNLRPCQPISCKDIRDRRRITRDGEFEIWIQGAKIRVYCYGMSTFSTPMEYLILHTAVIDDNYAQMIQKTRQCNLAKSMDYSTIGLNNEATVLYFKSVRFNVTSLQIITNDTRFAILRDSSQSINRSTNRGLISQLSLNFGEAIVQGCATYSSNYPISIRCEYDHRMANEAMFSINLQKTGLIIASERQWVDFGTHYNTSQMNIKVSRTKEKIVGYCGLSDLKYSMITSTDGSCRVGCRPISNTIQLQVY